MQQCVQHAVRTGVLLFWAVELSLASLTGKLKGWSGWGSEGKCESEQRFENELYEVSYIEMAGENFLLDYKAEPKWSGCWITYMWECACTHILSPGGPLATAEELLLIRAPPDSLLSEYNITAVNYWHRKPLILLCFTVNQACCPYGQLHPHLHYSLLRKLIVCKEININLKHLERSCSDDVLMKDKQPLINVWKTI